MGQIVLVLALCACASPVVRRALGMYLFNHAGRTEAEDGETYRRRMAATT